VPASCRDTSGFACRWWRQEISEVVGSKGMGLTL
jgi:hypothetical protein